MLRFHLGLFLSVAVLFPKTGNAQVYQFRAPSPDVTAADASWQMNSAPIVVDGLVYYPTRGFRFFDGQVMAQVGLFGGVPIYADTTIEPGSVIYVPIGRDRMREYERRRNRELAGTTGSRAPAFPVESPSDQALRARAVGAVGTTALVEPAPADAAFGTAGTVDRAADRFTAGRRIVGDARPVSSVGIAAPPDGPRPPTEIQSIPRPAATTGVWLDFDGTRWYSAGGAASFSTDRFEPLGLYRGFPVYREKNGNNDEIWVSVVHDGPLAPYAKR
jgi:hypothetical protein